MEFDSPALRTRSIRQESGLSSDLREQLAAAFPQVGHQLVLDVKGAKHPPYNALGVAESLLRYCEDLLPLSPLIDPRGKPLSVVKGNFSKLIDLKHKQLSKEELPASRIIECIENGTFDPDQYRILDLSRIRTLFWLPEVIGDPDAIYKNGHKIIPGDEVYVRIYDKQGARAKLVFTLDIRRKRHIIRTVPITSFLTELSMIRRFISGEPVYRRPQNDKTTLAGG
jgi:hypothetical protein